MVKIPGGYVLQPRKLDESKISGSPPHVREIWLYLVRRANYKDNHQGGLNRGQLFTSYSQIINDLSWYVGYRKESYKRHHCETAMKLLTKEHMITATKTTRGMVVTICNYDYYQNADNYETDTEAFKKTTREPQENRTISKEEKKERIKELKKKLMSDLEGQTTLNENENIALSFWKLIDGNLKRYGINSTDVAKATQKNWVTPVRLAIQNDNRTRAEFAEIFQFLKSEVPKGDFAWSKNILSTGKLREKFETLLLATKSNQGQASSSYTEQLKAELING